MADWKFGRRQGGCTICEREFLEQEPHVSVLSLELLEQGRRDICRECFSKQEQAGEPEQGRVWWRTRHTVNEKKGVQLDLESLHALFDALEQKSDEGWCELRYLLCLILMRKRRLKVLTIAREGEQEFFVVRKPRTEIEQRVQVFDFTPLRQEELRGTLHAIFEGADLEELDPNAPPPVPEQPLEADSGGNSGGNSEGDPEGDPEGSASESEQQRENGAADADPVGA